jgi:3-deoxy-manno-octulosonate cytidylyltransferase (CMP-KDO synthetase)
MNPIIVIPARMASSRLPGKPLADINGKPMIIHVIERALESDIGPVIVACGDKEIADVVQGFGIHAVMTDPKISCGSDRIYSALLEFDPNKNYDIVINLQGDVPSLNPNQLKPVLEPLHYKEYDIGTLVTPIRSVEEANTENFVKVACSFQTNQNISRALYFSRLPIPWGNGPKWHHVGIYSYRREALDKFVNLPPSLLENYESLEQLRALEAGMSIGCKAIEYGFFGVDTPKDLEKARLTIR